MFRKEEVDGKVVVEASGKSLGKAKDIAFGLDGSVALIVAGNDNAEIQITMDRITGVADYIAVRRNQPEPRVEAPPKKVVSAPAPAPAPAPVRVNPAIPPPPAAAPIAAANVCKGCGAPLRAGAKFCTKCGTPV
jgi:sporulation protein YlmC with PRC-barrel domain